VAFRSSGDRIDSLMLSPRTSAPACPMNSSRIVPRAPDERKGHQRLYVVRDHGPRLADQEGRSRNCRREGWITRTDSDQGFAGCLVIVQHAVNDPDLMRSTLTLLGPLPRKGKSIQTTMRGCMIAWRWSSTINRRGMDSAECHGGAWTPRTPGRPGTCGRRRSAAQDSSRRSGLIRSRAGWACNLAALSLLSAPHPKRRSRQAVPDKE